MISWIITTLGLVLSWFSIDLESISTFNNLVAPLLFGLFLITGVVKVAVLLGPDDGRGGGGFFGDSGGFGGGSCGGDGSC